jgi:hypothetical protein
MPIELRVFGFFRGSVQFMAIIEDVYHLILARYSVYNEMINTEKGESS